MKLVMYELNEVPYRVLETYAASFPRSSIANLLKTSQKFETHAEDEGILSPWITWPTVHRGVTNQKHCISDFGQDLQDINDEYPSFTQLLAQKGIKTGVFGSLHTYPLPEYIENYAFYVPDAFAAGSECFPDHVGSFQALNLAMLDRSGRNISRGIPKKEAFSFLAKIPQLGITPRTLFKLSQQVCSEMIIPSRKVRRRTSQTQLSFDVFMKLLRNKRPDFATFFTNHVASSMHRYWPGLFPSDYSNSKFDNEWLQQYSDEIFFTLHEANHHLYLLKQFVQKQSDTLLLILSSMGQAAVDGEELIKSQLFLTDKKAFMTFFGLSDHDWTSERAMAPRFVFRVHDEKAWQKLQKVLPDLIINGIPIDVKFYPHRVLRVKLGQANLDDNDVQLELAGKQIPMEKLGISNTIIEDSTASFAYHIPQGSCLIYNPVRNYENKKMDSISTVDIAPNILSLFEISPPPYMNKPGKYMFK